MSDGLGTQTYATPGWLNDELPGVFAFHDFSFAGISGGGPSHLLSNATTPVIENRLPGLAVTDFQVQVCVFAWRTTKTREATIAKNPPLDNSKLGNTLAAVIERQSLARGRREMASLDLHQTGDMPVLLTDVKGVAALLRRSERSIWRDDIAGRLPRSITLGGSKRWRIAEIQDWVEAGCPDRSAWEARETETGESRAALIQKNGGAQ